ncbi:MAG: hypothetical protein ACPLRW_04655 [Moorellales bacterium]
MLKTANAQEAIEKPAVDNVFYTGVLYSLAPVAHAAPFSAETLRILKSTRQQEQTEFTREALRAVGLESLLREGQDKYEFALTMPARRIQLCYGNGVVSVFAVSGNAWRGIARRLVARFTLDALGLADSEVPLEVLRALFSGGTLAKGLKSKPPSSASFSSELRAAVPLFDVFGGCLNGFMIPGTLRVGFVVPVTRETEKVIFAEEKFARVREIVRREREGILPTAEGIKPYVYTYTRQRIAELLEEQEGDGSSRGQDKDQMVYAVEAVPAGLHFGHWVGLVGPAEEGSKLCLEAAIALLGKAGFLGGKGAAGHGLFAVRYWTGDGRLLDFDACLNAYHDWLQKNRDRARTMLVETIMKETGYLVPDRVKKSLRVWVKCRDLLADDDGSSDAVKVGEFVAWLRQNRYLREDVTEVGVSAGLKDLRRIVDGLPDEVKQGLAEVTEAEIGSAASLVQRFGIQAESAKQAVRQLESRLRAISLDSWLNKAAGSKKQKADGQENTAPAETAQAS